jgi:Chaperone of endosialidase
MPFNRDSIDGIARPQPGHPGKTIMTEITPTTVSIAGDETLPVTPTGNPTPPTLSSLSCQADAVSATAREFLVNIGFTSAEGSGSTPDADKVALYAGIVGNSGTADIWAFNPLATLSPDSGSYTAYGIELDFNNLNADMGSADGDAGMAAPVAIGLAVSGAGNHLSNAAISIVGDGVIWNRGIVIPNPGTGGAIAQASFQDLGSATISLDLRGPNVVAVDTSKNTGVPLRIPNNNPIVALNAAGTGNVPIASVDIDDNIELGSPASSFIVANAHVIPALDNTSFLGFPTNRWAEIFAVNGTIQTSDPALKTDINPLPAAEKLIDAINPVTYRWKQDGPQFADVMEDLPVHATEWQEVQEAIIVIRDGKAVRTLRTRRAEVHLYDELPLEDEHGNPVTVPVPEQRDAAGAVLQPSSTRQLTHRVPRMVMKPTKVKRALATPGKRLHWGFLAPEVKSAFDAMGLDFGGHVLDEDGVHHLRPDQLIPVLWKAVQELYERVRVLEAKLP